MASLTLVQAINLALVQEMEKDDRVLLLGEDVGLNGGVFRVTEGLQKRFGDHRVVDTPLAESGIIGTSIGLAMAGLRPVPEIQFDGFLGPAYDQICSHAARMRTRTRGGLTVPLTIRVPVGGGIHAPELHSDSPENIYIHQPGLKVVMPSSPYDAKGLLIACLRDPDPCIFFEPKRIYRAFREEVPEDEYVLPIGKARTVCEGEDLTIVSWGASVVQCMQAIEKSERSIELIDLRTLYPFDMEAVEASVRKTGRCVIVHEAPKTGGLRDLRVLIPSVDTEPNPQRIELRIHSMAATKQPADKSHFILPDLGEGVHEAELISWKVKPGEQVQEHQTMAEMETDKALVEVPSPWTGVIDELRGSEGDIINVGSILVTYKVDGGVAPGTPAKDTPAEASTSDDSSEGDQGTVVGTMSGTLEVSSRFSRNPEHESPTNGVAA
ncbi:MAG: alpha-ketoacid dehydrogenase subunit beta, partial [Planctomycetota bacterium]